MSLARYKLIKQKPLSVYRTEPGSWVNGRWVEGAESTFTVKGHFYPLSADQKLLLPESSRSKSHYSLHTLTELYSVREDQSQSADRVEIHGQRYEVQEADYFSMGIRDHHEYLLVREEISGGSS